MASDADDGFPASEFWDFTIAHYGREGLSPAVIALQDRLGVDVNMLLLCCWAGSTGRCVTVHEKICPRPLAGTQSSRSEPHSPHR